MAKNEESLLGLLFVYPEHRKTVFEDGLLSPEDFFTDLNRRFFEYLRDCYFNSGDSHIDISEKFSEGEYGRLMRMKLSRMQLTENGSEVLFECIKGLRRSVDKKTSQKTNTYEGLRALLEKKRND